MTDNEIRIAIAEKCGYQWYWRVNGNDDAGFIWFMFIAFPPEEGIGTCWKGCAGETRKATPEEIVKAKTLGSFTNTSPDYPNDLNAMHEAEKVFHWEPENEHCPAQEYYEQLIFICGRNLPHKGKAFGYVCHLCGEQLYDDQQTETSESGMIHAECPQADCYDWHLITATARQRAEAFLRVFNLWKP